MTWFLGLLGGKIPAVIIMVLGLGMIVLGATTYFMIKKNGAQKQFIETLQGDMKALQADMTVAKAARDKSDQNLREFQAIGATLMTTQDKEVRRLKKIILTFKQRPVGAGLKPAPTLNMSNTIPFSVIVNPVSSTEVHLTDAQKQIECLDRLMPDSILDELFGVRYDQN